MHCFVNGNKAAHDFDADKKIGAIIITGSEKAFAGAPSQKY